MSLRQLTIGSAAMGSVGVLRMLTQFFIVPALARYLSPEDYGVVAIAMPFVLFGMMFSDAGMSASLIRTTSKNVAEWSTSFWLIMMLGGTLSIILAGVGYIISWFMNEPILFPIISALSLIIFLQSIATVPGASLQQHHKFTVIAGIEIAAMFLSLTGTYLAATHGWGAWSLVVQQLVHYTTKFILTLGFSPFRPHLVFRIREIIDHLTFGRDMVGNNFLGFVRQCLSNTIMGKALGTSAVGVATMASLFSDLPNRLVSGPIQLVVYPRMAKLKHDIPAVRGLFLFLSRIIAIMVVPVIGMLAAAHNPVFIIFLSEKWQQSGHLFMLMAPAAMFQTVTALRGTVAMSLGRTDIVLRQSWESAALAIAALLCAVSFGLEAVIIASTLVTLVYTPRALLQIFPLIDLKLREFIAVTIIPFITTAAGMAAYTVIAEFIDLTNWEAFAVAFFIGLIALAAAAFFQFSGIRSEIDDVRASLEEHTHDAMPVDEEALEPNAQ